MTYLYLWLNRLKYDPVGRDVSMADWQEDLWQACMRHRSFLWVRENSLRGLQ